MSQPPPPSSQRRGEHAALGGRLAARPLNRQLATPSPTARRTQQGPYPTKRPHPTSYSQSQHDEESEDYEENYPTHSQPYCHPSPSRPVSAASARPAPPRADMFATPRGSPHRPVSALAAAPTASPAVPPEKPVNVLLRKVAGFEGRFETLEAQLGNIRDKLHDVHTQTSVVASRDELRDELRDHVGSAFHDIETKIKDTLKSELDGHLRQIVERVSAETVHRIIPLIPKAAPPPPAPNDHTHKLMGHLIDSLKPVGELNKRFDSLPDVAELFKVVSTFPAITSQLDAKINTLLDSQAPAPALEVSVQDVLKKVDRVLDRLAVLEESHNTAHKACQSALVSSIEELRESLTTRLHDDATPPDNALRRIEENLTALRERRPTLEEDEAFQPLPNNVNALSGQAITRLPQLTTSSATPGDGPSSAGPLPTPMQIDTPPSPPQQAPEVTASSAPPASSAPATNGGKRKRKAAPAAKGKKRARNITSVPARPPTPDPSQDSPEAVNTPPLVGAVNTPPVTASPDASTPAAPSATAPGDTSAGSQVAPLQAPAAMPAGGQTSAPPTSSTQATGARKSGGRTRTSRTSGSRTPMVPARGDTSAASGNEFPRRSSRPRRTPVRFPETTPDPIKPELEEVPPAIDPETQEAVTGVPHPDSLDASSTSQSIPPSRPHETKSQSSSSGVLVPGTQPVGRNDGGHTPLEKDVAGTLATMSSGVIIWDSQDSLRSPESLVPAQTPSPMPNRRSPTPQPKQSPEAGPSWPPSHPGHDMAVGSQLLSRATTPGPSGTVSGWYGPRAPYAQRSNTYSYQHQAHPPASMEPSGSTRARLPTTVPPSARSATAADAKDRGMLRIGDAPPLPNPGGLGWAPASQSQASSSRDDLPQPLRPGTPTSYWDPTLNAKHRQTSSTVAGSRPATPSQQGLADNPTPAARRFADLSSQNSQERPDPEGTLLQDDLDLDWTNEMDGDKLLGLF